MLSLISPAEIKVQREKIIEALVSVGIPADVYKRTISKRKFKNDFDFVMELANELEPWDISNFEEATIEELKQFKPFFFFKQSTLAKQRIELISFLKEYPEFRANEVGDAHTKMYEMFKSINEWRRVNNLTQFKYLNQAVEYGGPTKDVEQFPIPNYLPMRQELKAVPSEEMPDNGELQYPPPSQDLN
jgi:hypothetical protein